MNNDDPMADCSARPVPARRGPPPPHPGQVQVRTFIAVVPPPKLVAELRRLQQRLAGKIPERMVRWLEADQLHITLRFLGNVRREQVPELENIVRRCTEDQGPFQLSLERLGCFPHTRAPRIIWVGVGSHWEVLRRLHERLLRDTEEMGDPQESREFLPHVTIGRIKAPSPKLARPAGQVVESAGIVQLGEWLAGRIDIIQSRLTPQQAVYTTLAKVRLSGLSGLAE